MGLSAFNRMRAKRLAEEEALKKASSEVVVKSIQPLVIGEKPKKKVTDAEKLKSKKN